MADIKKPEDVVTVNVHVAKDLLGSGSRYLDVRTSEDYNNGHVDNAVNVPYMFMTQEGRVKNPDFLAQVSSVFKKEEQLIVGCNIGGRAMKACVDLLNDGYQQVTRMGGGYTAWTESLKETSRSRSGSEKGKNYLNIVPAPKILGAKTISTKTPVFEKKHSRCNRRILDVQ
ncbi:protein HIGH ARSENIC CONTENT 1, mitochondrial [Heracleum sosnowskyi]|uniref:Protein HIGH ARSENIC CONTENT 1, mitochondrial n=1 Tax=Heracleum sosnowskyi TaxID=360622 RepID=A0AAD8JH93_9APIA|nr:protein HIGH ARSENIC CONTENT 1, mitochondrial [Heracleum sosnowskyi]